MTVQRWFTQFERAGLEGLVTKPLTITYQPDKSVMFKIKHELTDDCAIANDRVHQSGANVINLLLLGSYQDGS